MENQKVFRENDKVEFRVSVYVNCSLPVKGLTTHRIAAYRLSDIERNMNNMFQLYEFSNAKLRRKSKENDPILQDGEVIDINVNRRADF